MRRLLLALTLAFVLPLAHAQVKPPPKCWPSNFGPFQVGGTGSKVIWGSSQDVGIWFAWRCPDGSIGYKAAKEEWKGPTLSMLAIQAMSYPTIIDALTNMWSVYDTREAACTKEDPCDPNWQALAATAREEALKLPLPGAPVAPALGLVVAKNSTYPTRPAYALVNGALGKEVGRAPVGAPCVLALTVTGTGGKVSTYGTFDTSNSNMVALCTPK